jgi:DNA-binding response OmpR family regulator
MRVLVVEDIPRHANRIAEGLRDQGIVVDVAYDGHEAISKINVNPYDVVLLDRDLPGIHGDRLCQRIIHREDPPMVLMLTAAGAPNDRVKGLALECVGAGLEQGFEHGALFVGKLDRASVADDGGGQRVELDPGSLEDVAARCGSAAVERADTQDELSAEHLLQQAWDENVDPFTNTVRVTIARLRRELGPPDIIRTTPGVGYSISESGS